MYQTLNDNYEDSETSSNDIESGNACIICFEIDSKEAIDIKTIKRTIGKCSCSGYAHIECINKWYRNKNNIRCIMCNTLIARTPQRATTIRTTTVHTQPVSCKVMVFIILLTSFIVIIIFYPDAFQGQRKLQNDDSTDPSYLQAIMLGQY